MSSKSRICSMALSHLGISREISDVDTERSKEAEACRTFFDTARDSLLESFPWPFALRRGSLALVDTDPTTVWGYSYRWPSDALGFFGFDSGIRPDTRATTVSYAVESDSAGRLLYTSVSSTASGLWTVQITDTELFPASFVIALSYRLAALMAPRLTAGDPFKLGQMAMQLYAYSERVAMTNAARDVPDEPADSEFVTERG